MVLTEIGKLESSDAVVANGAYIEAAGGWCSGHCATGSACKKEPDRSSKPSGIKLWRL